MAKHYKETPWWWYIVVLVGSFVLGLIVVLKENITLPAWAYVVSLIVGIIIAPFVSRTQAQYPKGQNLNLSIEHHSLLSIRERYCNEQYLENAGRSYASWTSDRKHVLCSLVPQRHLKLCESFKRSKNGRIP